jgi:cytochrome P450
MSPRLGATAPDHVPIELVRDFQWWNLPGCEADPIRAAAEAARQEPEIFYAQGVRRDGVDAWVVTTQELIREIYRDTDTFVSKGEYNFAGLLDESWSLIPIEIDPPDHARWRVLLNPIFSPKRLQAAEETIRQTADQLLDAVLAKGEAEFVADFSEAFPVTVMLGLLGLPLEHTPDFLKWENDILHTVVVEHRKAAAIAIRDYLLDVIAERRRAPGDDLISYILTTPAGGALIADEEALSICFMLFTAGLDTVTATLGFMFKHLAEHPEHQQRLREDPSLIPHAVEEYLRAFPIVLSYRRVARDVEFRGVSMKAGDRVTLALMLAGRDQSDFPRADEVDFDRDNLSHVSFAVGPHRCLGSHLARRELVVALQAWMARTPPFRLKPGDAAVTHCVGPFGVDYLPLIW